MPGGHVQAVAASAVIGALLAVLNARARVVIDRRGVFEVPCLPSCSREFASGAMRRPHPISGRAELILLMDITRADLAA